MCMTFEFNRIVLEKKKNREANIESPYNKNS